MRSLNLDQLRAFLEVVECGSFSAAARRLNLSQPAVSLQIRELEQRLGVRLVERLGKQAHATAPGRELVMAAQGILRECEVTYAAMRRFRDGLVGRVHIGTALTAMIHRLPPILGKLRLEYPGIDLVVSNMPTQDSVEKILQNKIDLALVTQSVDNRQLRITPLLLEMMVAIFPVGTRDLPEEITPEYVARQPLLLLTEQQTSAAHPLVMGWLSAVAQWPQQPMPMGTVEALKSAVASNFGMAIVPEVAVAKHAPDIIVRPLRPRLSRTLALIEHHNKPNEPALEIVRNALLTLQTGGASDPEKPKRRPNKSSRRGRTSADGATRRRGLR
jgi:DNA-binding transcriptional LysR family regulator